MNDDKHINLDNSNQKRQIREVETSLISRLNQEFLHSSSRKYSITADASDHLTIQQKKAWAEILSSAATAEGEEENMVRPLKDFFSSHQALSEYIELHAQDEHRHAQMLKEYILQTFQYEKKKKTFTDKFVYGFLFQKIKALASHRPLPFLTTLYFYELYAEVFYSQLKKQSQQFNLPHLNEFFGVIQKDELRHIAGLKGLIQIWREEKWQVKWIDLALTRFLMGVVNFDVNTSRWAFYNKKLRRNMETLGLDPDFFRQEARRHAIVSYEKMRGLRG